MELDMTKEKRPATKTQRPAPEQNPVDAVLNELIERHPHLRAARDAMRSDGVVCNQFSQDALSAFRQHFRV